MLRFEDGNTVTVDDIKAFADWAQQGGKTRERSRIGLPRTDAGFYWSSSCRGLAAMRWDSGLGGDAQKKIL